MKSTCLLAAALLTTLAASAQRLHAQQVPEAVATAFHQAYPDVARPQWHQKAALYEVSFEQQQLVGGAVYTPTGALVETQTLVSYQQLPPLARTALMDDFAHRQIDKVFRVVKPSGVVTFAALVCRGKDKDCQTSVFDLDGRPLKD